MNQKTVRIRQVLLAVSGIFLVLGVYQNQHIDTMNKAIRICLECIGIG